MLLTPVLGQSDFRLKSVCVCTDVGSMVSGWGIIRECSLEFLRVSVVGFGGELADEGVIAEG